VLVVWFGVVWLVCLGLDSALVWWFWGGGRGCSGRKERTKPEEVRAQES